MPPTKPIVGLAGGIGAGKSEVSQILASMGAAIISSDHLNRQELENNEVKEILVQWWGPRILASDGSINRAAVSEIVFADETQKSRLEALTHPRIAQRRQRLMEQYAEDPSAPLIVIDSPLLFETHLDRLCDQIIFVEADRAIRLERVRANRGWSAEELDRREKMQQPLEFKRARADHICTNNSDVGALRHQVKAIFSRIVSGTGFSVQDAG